MQLYLDYSRWTQLFPSTVLGVPELKDGPSHVVLEADHKTEGRKSNGLRQLSPYEIELDEHKPQFNAAFINRFETEGDATRLVVLADVRLKGPYAILAPFLGAYVRHRIRRFVFEPMRAAVEAST